MDPLDLIDYIYDECRRQQVGSFGAFAVAHRKTKQMNAEWMYNTPSLFGGTVCRIAAAVEPDVNRITNWLKPGLNLRTTHVGFLHGGSDAAHPSDVYPRFVTLMEHGIDILKAVQIQRVDDPESLVNQWIKSLLDIHPWPDGNGRTASLLRNKILGTIDNPTPLPYFYGNA